MTADGKIELACGENCPKLARLREACLKCTIGKDWTGVHGEGRGRVYIQKMPIGESTSTDPNGLNDESVPGEEIRSPFHIDPVHGVRARPHNLLLDSVPENVGQYLEAVIGAIAAMELSDLEILHGLLNGKTVTDMSRAFGYSKQLIVARLKRAISNSPWMAALYTTGWSGTFDRKSGTWTNWNGTKKLNTGTIHTQPGETQQKPAARKCGVKII